MRRGVDKMEKGIAVCPPTLLSQNLWSVLYKNEYDSSTSISLGKGSKIKLIIFAEFSANGAGVPPIPENN